MTAGCGVHKKPSYKIFNKATTVNNFCFYPTPRHQPDGCLISYPNVALQSAVILCCIAYRLRRYGSLRVAMRLIAPYCALAAYATRPALSAIRAGIKNILFSSGNAPKPNRPCANIHQYTADYTKSPTGKIIHPVYCQNYRVYRVFLAQAAAESLRRCRAAE